MWFLHTVDFIFICHSILHRSMQNIDNHIVIQKSNINKTTTTVELGIKRRHEDIDMLISTYFSFHLNLYRFAIYSSFRIVRHITKCDLQWDTIKISLYVSYSIETIDDHMDRLRQTEAWKEIYIMCVSFFYSTSMSCGLFCTRGLLLKLLQLFLLKDCRQDKRKWNFFREKKIRAKGPSKKNFAENVLNRNW
jgi:hypothetical protein